MGFKNIPLEYRKEVAKKLGMSLECINSRIQRNDPEWDTRPVDFNWRSKAGRRGRLAGGWGNNFKLPGSRRD